MASPLRHGNWRVDWTSGGSFGPVARLDLQHSSSTTVLFREPRPKLIFILPNRGSTHWHHALPKWLLPLQTEWAATFKFVLAEPSTSTDMMRVFGVSAKRFVRQKNPRAELGR